jgi:hypothetical protein
MKQINKTKNKQINKTKNKQIIKTYVYSKK